MLLSIDPGNIKSAYVLFSVNPFMPEKFSIVDNNNLLKVIYNTENVKYMAIERIANFGKIIGKTTLDTCVWSGRFIEACSVMKYKDIKGLYRKKDICKNLCYSIVVGDASIRQVLIDRFGPVGTKNHPGWFFDKTGKKAVKDIWSAIAVGVTYYDFYLSKDK